MVSKHGFYYVKWHGSIYLQWRTPKLLDGFNASPKVTIAEGERVGVCSLARSILGVEGHVELRNGGYEDWQANQLLTRACTNQTTSWLMCNWTTLNARTSHEQPQTHKTHHNLDLGKATTFPLIVFFMFGHKASTQMSFCLRTPKWESQNSQNWDFHNIGGP